MMIVVAAVLYRDFVVAYTRDSERVQSGTPEHTSNGQSRKSGATIAAALLALLVLATAVTLGARAVGGADSFGYVSQAYLWLAGDLHIPQPLAAELPWPHARNSLTPLGYKPGGSDTIVPTYPPGLPLLMAGSYLLAGHCGPYWLPAVFAGLLVWSTFVLASRVWRSGTTGLVAAALVATSPVFLHNMVVPMSDTVTASLWTTALAVLTFGRRRHAAIGGCLAGVAIAVRPNLAPAVLALMLAAEQWRDRECLPLGGRSAAVAIGVVPAIVLVAFVNDRLYGSPFLSGYGQTQRLYALEHLAVNVGQFSSWLVTSEGLALWPLALAVFLAVRQRGAQPHAQDMPARAPLSLFAAIIAGSYLFYLPFDAWWFLRFLLPGLPIAFVAAAHVVAGWTPRADPRRRAVVLGAYLVLAAVRVWPYVPEIAGAKAHEERYAAVGRFVDVALPPNAAVLSMQHSSAIVYYSGRLIVRYDSFTAGRLPMVLEWIRTNGYRPYIVLDGTEEDAFRTIFGGVDEVGDLAVRTIGEWNDYFGRVRVFDPSQPPDGRRPFEIVAARHARCTGPHPEWMRSMRLTR